jgi:hypothetical protein
MVARVQNGSVSVFAGSDKTPFNSPIGLGIVGDDPTYEPK